MNHSPELGELASALAAAQAEFTAIPKSADNPFFRSKYADLPTVVATASPILTSHGLSVSQFIGVDDGGDTLTTWLLHKSGQFICESMRLHTSPAKGLSDTQAQGSAVSYARRYSYMSVLGLVADEDDDGNRTRKAPAAAKPVAAPPKPTTTVATEEQRQNLSALSDELVLAPTDLADAICGAAGQPSKEFASLDKAYEWCERALERLPARLVGDVEKRLRAMTGEKVAA